MRRPVGFTVVEIALNLGVLARGHPILTLGLAESNGHLSIDTSDDYVSELDVSRLIMLPFGTTEHPHSEPLRSY